MNQSTRSKVSVFIATSLDGFIARPDGDVAWLHEVEPIADGDDVEPIAGGEDGGYGEFFGSIDVLVMGRGTFEKVLEFDLPEWPYGSKPVIVLSKSLTEVPEDLSGRVRIDDSAPQELSREAVARRDTSVCTLMAAKLSNHFCVRDWSTI